MKKRHDGLLILLLLSCLCLNGCGDSTADDNPQSEASLVESLPSDTASPNSPTPNNTLSVPPFLIPDPQLQSANDSLDESAENVITLGLAEHMYYDVINLAAQFNESQSQYKIKLIPYDSYNSLIMDIVGGKGKDLFAFYATSFPTETLTRKGILEDLEPYFSSSDSVRKEDILSCLWEAGTTDGKFVCLIPSFMFSGIIVEKGHTRDGGWTFSDYLALTEEYPEGMLNQGIADPINLFVNDLVFVPEKYIDRTAGTCSFDSEEFISFLNDLKKCSTKKYEISPSGTIAERLYRREYLTLSAQIHPSYDSMNEYLMLKTLLVDSFELAGYPNADGEPCYNLICSATYAINSLSSKKEGAWAFLEYVISESVQSENAGIYFPARTDVLNQRLQAVIDAASEDSNSSVAFNPYTEEVQAEFPPFTEADRQLILNMIDHVKLFQPMQDDATYIMVEELKPYFSGDKRAEDVANIIQRRIKLYLDEQAR